jgi:hypothetical protein
VEENSAEGVDEEGADHEGCFGRPCGGTISQLCDGCELRDELLVGGTDGGELPERS